MDRTRKEADHLFHTTKWSMISEMNKLNDTYSCKLRNELFNDYYQPVYGYIFRRTRDYHKSIDLTQEFFIKCVIENNLFQKAERERGKFRTLIITALKNFLVSEYRFSTSSVRSPDNDMFSLDSIKFAPEIIDLKEKKVSEEDAFNFDWIKTMLINVSKRVEEYYAGKKSYKHWQAFNLRVLEPIMSESSQAAISDICKSLEIDDPKKVSDMIQNVRRKFRKELRNHIREYASTDGEVNDELEEFANFLNNFMQD